MILVRQEFELHLISLVMCRGTYPGTITDDLTEHYGVLYMIKDKGATVLNSA